MSHFYLRGRADRQDTGGKSTSRARRVCDFDQDAGAIYAAFYQAYKLSLTTVDFLHWWEFMALLENLPESTLFSQIMYYRGVNLNEIKDKHQRSHCAAMQRRFALKSDTAPLARSVEDITKENLSRVSRRFEEAARIKAENAERG